MSVLHKRRHHAFVLLVACLGIALSVLAFKAAQTWTSHGARVDFERDARDVILEVEKSIQGSLGVLDSIGSLYAASVFVERDEFRTFVQYGMLQLPGIQALEWIPRVPASQRMVYEEAARKQAYPHFQIVEPQVLGDMVPASFRDEYFPVYYVEPYQGNEIALGYDLASNPAYMEAMNKARDTGQKVATGRITLGEESEDQGGFLVFLSIFRNGAPTATLSDRRANLTGFALGDFRIKDIVENSMASINRVEVRRDIGIRLYDRTAQLDEPTLLAESFSTDAGELSQQPLRLADTFDVAGRNWEVVISSPELPVWLVWQPWAALMVGLLVTGCMSKYLVAGLRRTAIIERLVATRTRELTQSNQQLEQETAERQRAEEVIRKSEQRIRQLAAASSLAHEQERERTALEVHDRIGQPLVVAFQELQTLKRRTRAHSKQRLVTVRAIDLLQEAITESRNIMNDLYPIGLEDIGVIPVMESQLRTFEQETGLLVRFVADCPVTPPPEVAITFYRVLHEALTNVRRHAESATTVSVFFACRDQVVVLKIQDDGRGFDIDEATKMKRVGGIFIMERRVEIIGGSFEIKSSPAQGTRLTVRIPNRGSDL